MNNRVQTAAFRQVAVRLVLLCSISLPTLVLAGVKQYPLEGVVTALGTSQDTSGGDKEPVMTQTYRTYTVKTSSRLFTLKCPYGMDGIRIGPGECGGKKKIAIGDTIHFRVEKRHAYLQTDKGKEQRLEVLSEGVNDTGTREPSN